MQRIPLYGMRGVIRGYVKVDDEDYDLVAARRWHLTAQGYAAGPKKELMHRVILGLAKGDGIYVDHKNGDTLDNRRRNLLGGTQADNIANRRGATFSSTSRYRGVSLDRKTKNHKKVWIAQVGVRGKNHFLGRFETEEEAAAVAEAFRRQHLPTSRT